MVRAVDTAIVRYLTAGARTVIDASGALPPSPARIRSLTRRRSPTGRVTGNRHLFDRESWHLTAKVVPFVSLSRVLP